MGPPDKGPSETLYGGRFVPVSMSTMRGNKGIHRAELSRSPSDDSPEAREHLLSREMISNSAVEDEQRLARLETRSSSPSKSNFTLRERLGRLSRVQRKSLLLHKGTKQSIVVKEERETMNSASNSVSDSVNGDSSGDTTPSNSVKSHEFAAPIVRQAPPPPPPQRNQQEQRQQPDQVQTQIQPAIYKNPQKRACQPNRVKLHIYDLIAKDALVQLPFGCICEIGKCFNEMNTALHELGTGAYHVGVEVNGIEYAFGATSVPGKTGIFSCIPKLSPGYQYRKTIDFGSIPLVRKSWVSVPGRDNAGAVYREFKEYVDGRQLIKEMIPEYMGTDYDILRKNCCTFAKDVCLRLGVDESKIPSWFGNLAESGAMTQDMAYATVEPLRMVLSSCEEKTDDPCDVSGFEVIPRVTTAGKSGKKEIIVVIDALRHALAEMRNQQGRNVAWAY